MKIDTSRMIGSPKSQLEDFLELIWNRMIPFILGSIAVKYNQYINDHLWALITFVLLAIVNIAFHFTVRFNTNEQVFDFNSKKHKPVGRFGK